MKRALRLPAHVTIRPSGEVALRGVERVELPSGTPLYLITGGNEPVFRLELVFRAGKTSELQPNAASATAALLTDGTTRMSPPVLAEELEYYGATVRCYSSPDVLTFSVHAMTRFAQPVLELVSDILLTPSFPEDEFVLYQKKKIQRYRMGMMQNEYVANRTFSERVFGVMHPYGYTSTPDDVMALTVESLQAHHQMLGTSVLDTFLAGDLHPVLIEQVTSLVKSLPKGEQVVRHHAAPVQSTGSVHMSGPQPHQVSVRIGKQIVDRQHRDYPGLFLLNTLLGGYHGSRLIRNLREDKGLTYGIQSNLENLLESTCFVITTDANAELREQVIAEIYREIQLTRQRVAGKKELEMVKNYICGNLLMQIDGPFNVVDTIKPLILHQLPTTYFNDFILHLKDITAQEVKELAKQYLQQDSMVEVAVG